MSTKDPNLKVVFTSDTKGFNAGAKDVENGLKKLGKAAISSGGGIVKALGKVVPVLGAITIGIDLAKKATQDLNKHNQALCDSWVRNSKSMEAAFDSFKQAVNTMDFSNLIADMRAAASFAGALYDANDALGEVQTSYNLSLAMQQKRISQLKLDMADLSKSDEERIAAGNKLLKIYQKLEENPTRALKRVADATLDVMANRLNYDYTNISEATKQATRNEIVGFYVWLGTEAGESWNKAYADAVENPSQLWQLTINAQNAGLSDNYRALLWNYNRNVNDDDRKAVEEAIVNYYEQENKFVEETFKIRKQILSIQNASEIDAQRAADKAAASAAQERQRQMQAAAEIQEMLTYMAKRTDNELLYGNAFSGITSPTAPGVTVPVGKIIPTPTAVDNFQVVLSEYFAGVTIGIGIEPKKNALTDFTSDLENGLENMTTKTSEIMGNLVGTLVAGGDAWGDFKNAALSSLGDMAIAVGKIAVKTGVSMLGIKAALKLDNPYVAIAAGAALIALGAAVKSSLSQVASGDYSAGAGGYSSGYSSSSGGDWDTREVTVNVTGTLTANGDQLITVINNANKKNYYTQ